MQPRPFPPVHPHGDLTEVLPGVFRVQGSIKLGPMRISRNMFAVRQGDGLVLINSCRLDEDRLAQLDALGTVTDVLRLAGFHGSDDPFYKDRYGATIHAVEGMKYFSGANPRTGTIYFEADNYLTADSELPIEGASLYTFSCDPPEGILRLDLDGGTLVTGDSLQHWAKADQYFNLAAKAGMYAMGFLTPYALGKGWIGQIKPDKAEVRGILDLDFANVLPCHGEPVLGGAPDKYRPAIERYAG